jgi:hypothetical protein
LADCLENIQTYVQFELKPILNVRADREKQRRTEQEARLKVEQEARLKIEQEAKKKFQNLENYLKSQQWDKADQETWTLMLMVTNREKEGYLELKNIQNFPCEDLLKLDRLWVEYGKRYGFEFGFRIQKQIYVECGGKLDFSYPSPEIWDKFCDRIAWKMDGKWLDYSQLFSNKRFMDVKGHLPLDRRAKLELGLLFSHRDL